MSDGLGDALAREEPPRDRWGRVLLPDVDGRSTAYTRATTLAKALSGDKPGLTAWKIRLAMHGVVGNRTLHNLVAVTPLTDKAALDDIARRALEYAGANDGASKGSTLHAACARARVVPESFATLPADLQADVTAYAKCLNAAGVELDVDLIERMVVNDAVMCAGSFDDVVTVKGLPGRYVFDLKTAQDLSYSDAQDEIEIQLAVYANANLMVPRRWVASKGRAQFEAVPDGISKRWAIVAHLPAGSATCTLHWVDIRRGWMRAKLAFEARRKGVGFVAWGIPGMPTVEVPIGVDDLVYEVSAVVVATGEPATVTMSEGYPDGYDPDDGANLGTAHPLADRIMATEKPRRKRRTRAEIEAAKRGTDVETVPLPSVVEADRLAAALSATTGDDVVVVPTAPGASDGTFHPDGTFTPYGTSGGAVDTAALNADPATMHVPDRFGDESRPDPVGPSAFTKLARAEAVRGHVEAGRVDISDAALDRTLAERDRENRDRILAERRRARIDAEIRAAIDDATKVGTPQSKAQKELATAWELWQADWTDEHTAYAKTRLAALPPF